MSEWPYIIAAYAVTWILLGGFALYLLVRERQALRAANGGGGGGGGGES